MTNPVLVAYATRYGSTREVAEVVATTLREHGLAAELHPTQEVRDLDQFGAVVLGAALYVSHWPKDAHRFLERHRAALVARPVAVFTLGPIHADEKEFKGARDQLDKELAKFPWLRPMAVAVFGGKFDPTKLGFPFSAIPALRNMPASDARDWAVIRAWAGDLAARFAPAAEPADVRR